MSLSSMQGDPDVADAFARARAGKLNKPGTTEPDDQPADEVKTLREGRENTEVKEENEKKQETAKMKAIEDEGTTETQKREDGRAKELDAEKKWLEAEKKGSEKDEVKTDADYINEPLSSNEAARKYYKDVLMAQGPQTATANTTQHARAAFTVLNDTSELWRGSPSVIKYCFFEGANSGTSYQQNKVRTALEEWTWYSNVRLEEATTDANVCVTFDSSPSKDLWSLGRTNSVDAMDAQTTMNLGWIEAGSEDVTKAETARILHEFGHVLGMLHEHQSPASVGVALKNVDAALKFYGK